MASTEELVNAATLEFEATVSEAERSKLIRPQSTMVRVRQCYVCNQDVPEDQIRQLSCVNTDMGRDFFQSCSSPECIKIAILSKIRDSIQKAAFPIYPMVGVRQEISLPKHEKSYILSARWSRSMRCPVFLIMDYEGAVFHRTYAQIEESIPGLVAKLYEASVAELPSEYPKVLIGAFRP